MKLTMRRRRGGGDIYEPLKTRSCIVFFFNMYKYFINLKLNININISINMLSTYPHQICIKAVNNFVCGRNYLAIHDKWNN